MFYNEAILLCVIRENWGVFALKSWVQVVYLKQKIRFKWEESQNCLS